MYRVHQSKTVGYISRIFLALKILIDVPMKKEKMTLRYLNYLIFDPFVRIKTTDIYTELSVQGTVYKKLFCFYILFYTLPTFSFIIRKYKKILDISYKTKNRKRKWTFSPLQIFFNSFLQEILK